MPTYHSDVLQCDFGARDDDRMKDDSVRFPEVGRRMYALWQHVGGTQEEFADLVGVRRTEMSTAIRGHNMCKTPKWLLGIGAVFGTTADRTEAFLRGRITFEEFTSGPKAPPASGAPIPMHAFLAWYHGNPAIAAAALTYRDVSVDDMARLYATPAREAEASPAKVYEHIKQLRRGDIGEQLKVRVVGKDTAEAKIKAARAKK